MNLLAANLTTQVRAIAEVATAVTKGDLTRAIQVETRGEVAELKDNINTMISNLRETTESNREQDELKTNLAKFTGMLQGHRELSTVGKMLLSELAPLLNIYQGTIYHLASSGSGSGSAQNQTSAELKLLASYAHGGTMRLAEIITVGEGQNEYAQKVVAHLKSKGLRARADLSHEKLGSKKRDARNLRVPYILAVGDREAQEGKVAPWSRDTKADLGPMPLEQFTELLVAEAMVPRILPKDA